MGQRPGRPVDIFFDTNMSDLIVFDINPQITFSLPSSDVSIEVLQVETFISLKILIRYTVYLLHSA